MSVYYLNSDGTYARTRIQKVERNVFLNTIEAELKTYEDISARAGTGVILRFRRAR